MKKILKNKKGFTLVELLAVIVVLAIIMVIATQQINKTIKKSRGDSFYDSVLMIEKNAKMLCVQNSGEITIDELKTTSDLSDDDYVISIGSTDSEIKIQGKGKFKNMTLPTNFKSTVSSVSGSSDTLTLKVNDCKVSASATPATTTTPATP